MFLLGSHKEISRKDQWDATFPTEHSSVPCFAIPAVLSLISSGPVHREPLLSERAADLLADLSGTADLAQLFLSRTLEGRIL